MRHSLDLRQVLQAGLWTQLDSTSKQAIRLTCKETHDQADALVTTARLSAGHCDTNTKAMTQFHRKLPLVRRFVANLHLGQQAWSAVQSRIATALWAYQSDMAANGGLPSVTCLDVQGGIDTCIQPTAVDPLVDVLPNLQEVYLNGNVGDWTKVLSRLAACLRLRTFLYNPGYGHPPYEQDASFEAWYYNEPIGGFMSGLCSLTNLTSLRGPWLITHKQLQQLTAHMPALECLGCYRFEGHAPKGVQPCPTIHTLTGPPSLKGPWQSSQDVGILHFKDLAAFPALSTLLNCQLCAVQDCSLEPFLRGLPALVSRLAACAESWVLCLPLSEKPAMRTHLQPGSLAALHNLQLHWDDDNVNIPSAIGIILSELLGISDAAPQIGVLELVGYWPRHVILEAVLPALRRLSCLHTLVIGSGGADKYESDNEQCADQTALLMGLVCGLALPSSMPASTQSVSTEAVPGGEAATGAAQSEKRRVEEGMLVKEPMEKAFVTESSGRLHAETCTHVLQRIVLHEAYTDVLEGDCTQYTYMHGAAAQTA